MRRLGRRPVLDGLRGAAFLLVFVGHAGWLPFLRGGQTAMFLFFALSGFLITQLLAEERDETGRVRLGRFFGRRALRLFPALLAFLAIWLAVVVAFPGSGWIRTAPGSTHGHVHGMPPLRALEDAGLGLGYVFNWLLIFGGHESSHQPLTHLWSLSVEEQFYVMWAPTAAFLLAAAGWIGDRSRRRRDASAGAAGAAGRRLVGVCAVILALASLGDAGYHYFLASVHQPRVSYGTDTRAGAFLLGGALALVWSSGLARTGSRWLSSRLPAGSPSWRAARSVSSLCVSAVAFWLLASGRLEGDAHGYLSKSLSYLSASVAASLIVVLLVAAPSSHLGRLLSHPVATYIGRRSYALYLWHYVWLTWLHGLGTGGEVLALACSFGSAEASWRYVESKALRLRGRLEPTPSATGPRPEAVIERIGADELGGDEIRVATRTG